MDLAQRSMRSSKASTAGNSVRPASVLPCTPPPFYAPSYSKFQVSVPLSLHIVTSRPLPTQHTGTAALSAPRRGTSLLTRFKTDQAPESALLDAAVSSGPIVVAWDETHHSQETLRWVVEHLAHPGDEIAVLHVVCDPRAVGHATAVGASSTGRTMALDTVASEISNSPGVQTYKHKLAESAHQRVEAACAAFQQAGLSFKILLPVAEGYRSAAVIGEEVLNAARRAGARMLVSASHGPGAAVDFGSVTRYCLQHAADLPLILVPPIQQVAASTEQGASTTFSAPLSQPSLSGPDTADVAEPRFADRLGPESISTSTPTFSPSASAAPAAAAAAAATANASATATAADVLAPSSYTPRAPASNASSPMTAAASGAGSTTTTPSSTFVKKQPEASAALQPSTPSSQSQHATSTGMKAEATAAASSSSEESNNSNGGGESLAEAAIKAALAINSTPELQEGDAPAPVFEQLSEEPPASPEAFSRSPELLESSGGPPTMGERVQNAMTGIGSGLAELAELPLVALDAVEANLSSDDGNDPGAKLNSEIIDVRSNKRVVSGSDVDSGSPYGPTGASHTSAAAADVTANLHEMKDNAEKLGNLADRLASAAAEAAHLPSTPDVDAAVQSLPASAPATAADAGLASTDVDVAAAIVEREILGKSGSGASGGGKGAQPPSLFKPSTATTTEAAGGDASVVSEASGKFNSDAVFVDVTGQPHPTAVFPPTDPKSGFGSSSGTGSRAAYVDASADVGLPSGFGAALASEQASGSTLGATRAAPAGGPATSKKDDLVSLAASSKGSQTAAEATTKPAFGSSLGPSARQTLPTPVSYDAASATGFMPAPTNSPSPSPTGFNPADILTLSPDFRSAAPQPPILMAVSLDSSVTESGMQEIIPVPLPITGAAAAQPSAAAPGGSGEPGNMMMASEAGGGFGSGSRSGSKPLSSDSSSASSGAAVGSGNVSGRSSNVGALSGSSSIGRFRRRQGALLVVVPEARLLQAKWPWIEANLVQQGDVIDILHIGSGEGYSATSSISADTTLGPAITELLQRSGRVAHVDYQHADSKQDDYAMDIGTQACRASAAPGMKAVVLLEEGGNASLSTQQLLQHHGSLAAQLARHCSKPLVVLQQA